MKNQVDLKNEATAPQSIDCLSMASIEKINAFLAELKRPIFTSRYIRFMQSAEFTDEVKSNSSILYRGQISKPTLCLQCQFSNKTIHVLNLLSCNAPMNEVLLLDDEFQPLIICSHTLTPSFNHEH